jgi:phosphoesterase RecJ-like protein
MQYSNIIPDHLLSNYEQVIEKIDKSNAVLIASHLRPDGDAIGSVSGLAKALLAAGKEVEVALRDGVPERFAFVFPDVKLHKSEKINASHDLVLILDAGDETRTGIDIAIDPQKTSLINIDHHASNTNFAPINLVDTKASSTCEMITALLYHSPIEIGQSTALSLLLGLITDSRSFQNEGIRYTAHLAAAILLATGVDNSPILTTLNSGRSETDLRVQGFGLCNFKLECNKNLATLVITQNDLQAMHAKINNIFASGIFNILTSIKTTLASVVIFERDDGVAFCEFRSRGGVNVKEVAVAMGGGGHIPASGCSRQAPVKEVANEAIERMIAQVNKFLEGKKA